MLKNLSIFEIEHGIVHCFTVTIFVILIFTQLLFVTYCAHMAGDHVYCFANNGAWVNSRCHRSVGQILSNHTIHFKNPLTQAFVQIFIGSPRITIYGSGFYFDKNRPFAATNSHVVIPPEANIESIPGVEENPEFEIVSEYFFIMDSGEKFPCCVVANYPDRDMAIVLVDTKYWSPLPIADPEKMKIGEKVYAIGSPLGVLHNSFTDGVISGANRDISRLDDATKYPPARLKTWIQHTAHVNPGNSGGPLVNHRGEVLGINTLSFNNMQGISGIYMANRIDLLDVPKFWIQKAPEKK